MNVPGKAHLELDDETGPPAGTVVVWTLCRGLAIAPSG